MKPIDLSKILAKHKEGWIALTPDNKKLVATGGNLSQVLKKAKGKGVSNPSVFKSPKIERLNRLQYGESDLLFDLQRYS